MITRLALFGICVAIAGCTTGGALVNFTEGTNMAAALNPAGSRYVLSLQGTLFELPARGGRARALTDYYQDAREPQFAPDGNTLVYHGYANGTWDIWQLTLASGALRALTSSPFDDREPVVSPDGRHIAFASDRSGNYDIWQLTLADGRLTQLTDHAQDEYSPSYASLSSASLAFARHTRPAETELVTLNLATHAQRVVRREAGQISGVSVSPFGSAIAYQLLTRDASGHARTQLRVAYPDGAAQTLSAPGADVFPFRPAWLAADRLAVTMNGGLHVVNTGAGDQLSRVRFRAAVRLQRPAYERRQRTYEPTSQQALGIVSPALSHDGSRVAFTALGDLWQFNLDNGDLLQITDDPFAESTPVYAPDAVHIAFVSDRGGSAQLWVHNFSDGSQRLLDDAARGVSYPSWSPDGTRLAYFGELPGNPLGGQLMLANLLTGESTAIGAPTPPQPLSWSADSQHLAATVLNPYSARYREGMYELLVFDTDGASEHRISLLPHLSPLEARLTPDGAGIGFVQGGRLWYLPIDAGFRATGPAHPLTTELADMPSWSGDGRYVVYVSGDRLRRLRLGANLAPEAFTVPLDWQRSVATQRYTLRTSALFDGEHAGYRKNRDVVINGNRIEAITRHRDSNPHPVIDVRGQTVIPGLFEMHAHMGLSSEAQGRVWLANGITTVRDPGSMPYLAKERQEAWDSGRRPGPRTHITGYLADGNRVFYSMAEGLADADQVQLALQRTQLLELDFIKTYVRLPDHLQRQVVEFAHQLGVPVSSHELFPAAAHGTDHVEHIGGTSRRGYQPKVTSLGYSYNDVVELLARSGMGITPTIVLPAWAVIYGEDADLFTTAQFETFYGPEVLRGYRALLQRYGEGAKSYHTANSRLLRELVKRDALLVTGTDAPFVPYGTGLHAELRLFERAGLKPWQVLRAATAKAAQAAGVANELGRIAPGMLADMVVIDGDPLASIKDADNVSLTIKGGRRYPIAELLVAPSAE